MRISLAAVARFPHIAFVATYVESRGQNELHVLVEHAATNSPTPTSDKIGNYEKSKWGTIRFLNVVNVDE